MLPKFDVRTKRKRLMKADAASSKKGQRRVLIVCKQCCKQFIQEITNKRMIFARKIKPRNATSMEAEVSKIRSMMPSS